MNVIIMDNPARRRSPLLSQYYDAIRRGGIGNDKVWEFSTINDLPMACEDMGFMPDVIFHSTNFSDSFFNYSSWINKNKIIFITEAGDPYQCTQNSKFREMYKHGFCPDVILSRTSHGLPFIEGFKDMWGWDTDIHYIPWCIDCDIYNKLYIPQNERKYDSVLIASFNSVTDSDSTREEYRKTLLALKDKYKIYAPTHDNVLNQGYHDDSPYRYAKILPVEGNSKVGANFLTQRYLIAAALGVLIIGEKPGRDGKDFMIDGETMVVSNGFGDDWVEKFEYYLKDDMERIRIATNAREMVHEMFPMKRAMQMTRKIIESRKRR